MLWRAKIGSLLRNKDRFRHFGVGGILNPFRVLRVCKADSPSPLGNCMLGGSDVTKLVLEHRRRKLLWYRA